MSLVVNTNIAAMDAYRNLTVNENNMQSSLQKLSSGNRINTAGDDAAGLVISTNINSQVSGLKVAVQNANDGISVVQTADGALNEVTTMLQRIRDLAVQSANSGAQDSASLTASQAEVTALVSQISSIATQTQFNGVTLLTGANSPLTFQVGANAGETLSVSLQDMRAAALGVSTANTAVIKDAAGNTLTHGLGTGGTGGATSLNAINLAATTTDAAVGVGEIGASAAISVVDGALAAVNAFRGSLGAAENQLQHTVNNLSVTSENLAASASRITDTDMASEMTNYSKDQILTQVGTAMLTQANQSSQGVLKLIQNL
jgi:flagellin